MFVHLCGPIQNQQIGITVTMELKTNDDKLWDELLDAYLALI